MSSLVRSLSLFLSLSLIIYLTIYVYVQVYEPDLDGHDAADRQGHQHGEVPVPDPTHHLCRFKGQFCPVVLLNQWHVVRDKLD